MKCLSKTTTTTTTREGLTILDQNTFHYTYILYCLNFFRGDWQSLLLTLLSPIHYKYGSNIGV